MINFHNDSLFREIYEIFRYEHVLHYTSINYDKFPWIGKSKLGISNSLEGNI